MIITYTDSRTGMYGVFHDTDDFGGRVPEGWTEIPGAVTAVPAGQKAAKIQDTKVSAVYDTRDAAEGGVYVYRDGKAVIGGAGNNIVLCPADTKAGWAYDRDAGTFAAPPSEAPLSLEDKLRALSSAVQKVLDGKAAEFGFTDIRSAAGYAANYALGSRGELDTAGAKLTKWRSAVWQFLDDEKKARTPQQLNDITPEKVFTEMPQFSGITL